MKRSEFPTLDDLRAFEAVARLGSVRAAADELALTHGAVSRRVSKLSLDLGLRLLERDGRGVRLTVAGEVVADAATRAFRLIADSLAAARRATGQGPVTLSCERSLAMRWLIPRLSGFQDLRPEMEIHLATGGGGLDFDRDRVSLAIRRLDFPLDPQWTVIPLMPERMGPVMTPHLREGFEAGAYVALGSRTRPDAWRDWLEAHPEAPRPQAMRRLDHHFLMVEAALGGLGVAMSPQALVVDDVGLKRLEAPLGFDPDGARYGLIHPRSLTFTEDLAALSAWLVEQAARLAGDGPQP